MISYRIPTYRYHGPLVHFAAYEGHCSFYVVSKLVLEKSTSELKGFKASGTTIRFSPEKPLPSSLVKRIVKARIDENESRSESNQ